MLGSEGDDVVCPLHDDDCLAGEQAPEERRSVVSGRREGLKLRDR